MVLWFGLGLDFVKTLLEACFLWLKFVDQRHAIIIESHAWALPVHSLEYVFIRAFVVEMGHYAFQVRIVSAASRFELAKSFLPLLLLHKSLTFFDQLQSAQPIVFGLDLLFL
jgi:hypothetical protein